MIWTSVPVLFTLDLIIFALIVLMFYKSVSLGMFEKGRMTCVGWALILAGVAVTGLFYLADLLIMTVLPTLMPEQQAVKMMTFPHLELRWNTSLLSISLIASGITIVAYKRRQLEEDNSQIESLAVIATDRAADSDLRFNAMLEQSTDSIYCFESVGH